MGTLWSFSIVRGMQMGSLWSFSIVRGMQIGPLCSGTEPFSDSARGIWRKKSYLWIPVHINYNWLGLYNLWTAGNISFVLV